MAYFDRLRDLAAARAAPARGRRGGVAPLEVEEVRVAAPPQATATAAPGRRTAVPVPRSERRELVAMPAPVPDVVLGELGPAPPPAARETVRHEIRAAAPPSDADSVPAPVPVPLDGPAPAQPAAARAPDAAAPVREPQPPPVGAPRAAAPEAVEVVVASGDRPAAVPAPAAARPAGRAPAAPLPRDGEARVHAALTEVRRWIQEPAGDARDDDLPLRREGHAPRRPSDAPPQARAAVSEARTELSIGTIQVTVEEPAAAPARRAPRPAAAPRRAGRDTVPRDYLRGW